MLALIAAVALAEPVVHSGDAAEALARAAAATGRPASSFEARDLAGLRAGPPTLVGAGSVQACDGPSVATNEQLTWRLQRADGAVAYGDTDEAVLELAEARTVLTCLGVPVDAGLLERFRAIAVELGQGPRPGEASLRVVAPSGPVHVDGAAVTGPVDLDTGAHAVLIGGSTPRSLVVDLPPGDATVVVPAAFGPDALDATDDPDARAPVTALLAATLGEGAPVFVVTEEAVYAATAGRTDWIALSRRTVSPALVAGRVTTGIGVAVAVGAGVPAVLSWQSATRHRDAMNAATSTDEWVAARDRYDRSVDTLRATRFVPAAGAALGLVGVGLMIAGAPEPLPVEPVAVNGGFGLALRVRR